MSESKDGLFNIWTCDKAGTTKITNRIFVATPIDPDNTATLETIRALLITDNKLDSKKARLPFCTKDGARIGDDAKWSLYEGLIAGKPKAGTKDKAKDNAEDNVGASVHENTGHDVYFELPEEETKRSKYVELSEPVKNFLQTPLDMNFAKDKVDLLTATIKDFNLGGYDHSEFKSIATADSISAGSLSDEDWDRVCRTTHFLHGQRMVFSKNLHDVTRTFQRIDKAPYASKDISHVQDSNRTNLSGEAFSIKPRDLSELGTAGANIKLPKDTALHRYPLYIVTDDSYVNVFETANALSSSLASSNFSQTDIEASIGGTLFGISAGAQAGYSESDSDAVASANEKKHRTMNITYNVGRSILLSLELTPNCETALKQVKDKETEEALIEFYQNFGHFFATNVELGGKLFATEQFTSEDKASTSEKANAMKISAALSFSSPWVQGSASYSNDKQHAESESKQTSSMSKALSWEAVGGDTTLCNNPPAWCSTVKPFRNWRVINQKDVMPIGDFIGTFDGYEHIPSLFRQITQDSNKIVISRFRLRADEGSDGKITGTQYYGLRCNPSHEKNIGLFEALKHHLLNSETALYNHKAEHIENEIDKAERKLGSAGYTVNWHEYIGIDTETDRTKEGGCVFEVKVWTQLHQPASLQYDMPYPLWNKAYGAYVAADTSTHIAGTDLGILYYTSMPEHRAYFKFLKVRDHHATGRIGDKDHVELHLCDKHYRRIGQVKRFKGDYATLAVEMGTSAMSDIFAFNNAYMEYCR
ncbi:hypothetical protein PENANT_c011G00632 [Penicillium antarcticum]|uniref:MACPF-like domain-containing protein n=1 Tax=Penicillium antarcticum TaxID=416450 RepID=A0A1V6Q792_9EURO|nr:hypothetical protein PENANT_c011G00632 [Penicillium antarcticum]